MELEAGLLASHHQAQHGTSRGPQWAATTPPPTTRLYRVSFTQEARLVGCPLEGCGGRELVRTNPWIHFVNGHMQDTILILEEGKCPHPLCLYYNMFII